MQNLYKQLTLQDRQKEKKVSSPSASNFYLPYRTLDEFLEMKEADRHAMSIHDIEFEFLRNLFDEPDENWLLSIEKPGVKIQRKYTEHSNCILIRAWKEMPGIEPETVLYNMLDFERRAKWDDLISNYTNVHGEERSRKSDIVYFVLPAPVIKDRDFVVYQRIRADETPKGKGYSILQRSTDHPFRPVIKNFIRGETHLGGITIHRDRGSTTSTFCVTGMTDPCGSVPKWLVNFFTSMKIGRFMDKLKTACEKLQKSLAEDPALRAHISEYAARFHRDSVEIKDG